jgi:hypothetical protein
MPFWPMLFARASIGYSFVPLLGPASLSLMDGALGAGFRIDLSREVEAEIFGSGGYFFALLQGGSGRGSGNPLVAGGVGVRYALFPSFSVGLEESYRLYYGLYSDLSMGLSATYTFTGMNVSRTPAGSGGPPQDPERGPVDPKNRPDTIQAAGLAGVELGGFEFFDIFPVFYKYYNDHPLGRATLRNTGKTAAKNIQVTFQVKQYMDNPKSCVAPQTLAPGEEREVQLFGLFKSNMLEISQSTLVSANIALEYEVAGEPRRKEFIQAVRVQDRNAMTWEDDRRAAAFVTPKDPTVLKFARNTAALLKGKMAGRLPAKLLTAIGIQEALRLYGIVYAPDPKTPYADYSRKKETIDFLQFPQNSLENRGGDCDDLSILCCALLESVGIATAFITVPEHIFIAFSLDMSLEQARQIFDKPEQLLFFGGGSWVPLEVTAIDQGFLKAWALGAREWAENHAAHKSAFYPLSECWAKYEPVGFSGAVVPIELPPDDRIINAFTDEVNRLIEKEVSPRADALRSEIQHAVDARHADAARNRLGILYARFGMLEQAEGLLGPMASNGSLPAMVNMGNLCLLRKDPGKALPYYMKALTSDPENSLALLGSARARYAMNDFTGASQEMALLKSVDPDLAAKYTILAVGEDPGRRDTDVMHDEGEMPWMED